MRSACGGSPHCARNCAPAAVVGARPVKSSSAAWSIASYRSCFSGLLDGKMTEKFPNDFCSHLVYLTHERTAFAARCVDCFAAMPGPLTPEYSRLLACEVCCFWWRRRSSGWRLSRRIVLEMRSDLMRASSGESHVKLGEWFTSISHGRYFLSTMMSKPRISKQRSEPASPLSQQQLWYTCASDGWIEMSVLTTTSPMRSISPSGSWPCARTHSLNQLIERFEPSAPSRSDALSACTNLSLCLLIA